MRTHRRPRAWALLILFPVLWAVPSAANVSVQCPGDTNGDAVIDTPDPLHPNAKCMHLAAGDGFVTMADGKLQYCFGFADVTGVTPDMVMDAGMLAASASGPTVIMDEGDEFYLTLTNVGMTMRPDLFDPHTVHFHGFPQAAPIFDGMPDGANSIVQGSSNTYYYNVVFPGTYMYHCHVEATEHMQMGMLGNLYVRPAQNKLPNNTNLSGFTHHTGYKYAYNDGDGTTVYDVEFAIQLDGFDSVFHDASMDVEVLPMAMMRDNYPLLNGRGYPDTVDPNPLPAPEENGGKTSQWLSSLIQARVGQKVLLRLSNLNVTRVHTLAILGMPMNIVGHDARLLRSASGENLYYKTSSLTLGGGETYDAILDMTGVPQGTYFLYAANLQLLSNNQEDFGGMMTEIVVSP